jgi:NAD+ kinase
MKAITLFPSTVKKALDVALEMVEWLAERKIPVLLPEDAAIKLSRTDLMGSEDVIRRETGFLLSMGGDGTLLRAARFIGAAGIPILGINLGRLGFLTEVPVSLWKEALQRIIDSRYDIVQRLTLTCEVKRGGRAVFSGMALNDVVIHRGGVSRLLDLEIAINERYVGTYSADGLIIATPTGSTAYSLSAGGPIVDPDLSCIILTAICPHTLSARPLVVSDDQRVAITEKTFGGISLSLDGQSNIVLEKNDEVLVRKADFGMQFIHLESNFYQIVREKLKWVSHHSELYNAGAMHSGC